MNTDSPTGAGLEMIGLGWVIFFINLSYNFLNYHFQFAIPVPSVAPASIVLLWIDAILTNAHHVFTFGLGAFQLYVTYLGYKKIKKQLPEEK